MIVPCVLPICLRMLSGALLLARFIAWRTTCSLNTLHCPLERRQIYYRLLPRNRKTRLLRATVMSSQLVSLLWASCCCRSGRLRTGFCLQYGTNLRERRSRQIQADRLKRIIEGLFSTLAMCHSELICCSYWQLFIRRSPCVAGRTSIAWRRKFGVGQSGLPLQSGVSDTGGIPEVLAARVPEQRHWCMPLGRAVGSCLSYISKFAMSTVWETCAELGSAA